MPPAPGSNVYHAFISYSHAADGELAPSLQSGLQRFAKPWYRPRALRVFRDDVSLSANPHLWTSIGQALGVSHHFILLASPQAAASPWVGREAEFWHQKSTDTLLVGLTEGELAWDETRRDFDWEQTTALPRALEGAFTEEPRWIDLRRRETVTISRSATRSSGTRSPSWQRRFTAGRRTSWRARRCASTGARCGSCASQLPRSPR